MSSSSGLGKKIVCVTGGSGYIASWLVKFLLQRGYTVKASVRDPKDPKKVEHLLKLDGAKERLHLFAANLLEDGSFDAAVEGCEGVFHTASPFYHKVTDPQAELIDPALKGTLNVLGSCVKASSVKRVVVTSSVAAVAYNGKPRTPEVVVDETWFSNPANAAPVLVSALKYIHAALIAARLDSRIKVSTAHSSSIILDSFPPSQAFFNRTWDPVMIPLLKFLQDTGSYLMLNVYPYYDYMQSHNAIPLDYALFRPLPPNKEAVDSNTLLHYTNVFDAVVDAAYFAMSYLNFTNIPIVVTESGWPSKGDSTEPDATLDNANTYNSNLIKHVINNTGTPKHPGVAVSTFIYELYNEDARPGSVSEKNWGLFDANGRPIYILHLTGSGTMLANDTTNQTYCVAREGVDRKMLQAALDWACGPGKVDCSAMVQGAPCYEPDTVAAHATYAFDAYYHRMGMAEGTCDFNGVASITTTDPSHGSCIFPGSRGSNGTFINATSLAPSSNSSSSGSSPLINSYDSVSCLRLLVVLFLSVVFL